MFTPHLWNRISYILAYHRASNTSVLPLILSNGVTMLLAIREMT